MRMRDGRFPCPGCRCEHFPGSPTVADERGFARCAECAAIFLIPKDIGWPDEPPFYRTDAIDPPLIGARSTKTEVPATRVSAYRSSGAERGPRKNLELRWRDNREQVPSA